MYGFGYGSWEAMQRAMVAWWDTEAIFGGPVVPLVEKREEMVSFEEFEEVKFSQGVSPCWRRVSQEQKPEGMVGLWGVLKINMLVLGIGTERLLFASMMVGSCSGDVIMYFTDA